MINLTEAMLEKLTAPGKGKEIRLHDKKKPGLMLRWRDGGKKRWYLFQRVGARMVQQPLGHLNSWPAIPVETAREMATQALAKLGDGISPADEREAARKEKADKAAQVVPLSEVWKLHEKKLNEKKRCAEHIREMALLVTSAAAAGIVDLRHPGIAAKAENWLDSLGLAPSTIRRRRGFFKSLGGTAKKHWPSLASNPFDAWEFTADTTPPIELFTLPECSALVSDKGIRHPWGPLGAVLLYHGLRLKEGVWLHWDRIDPEVGVLRVTPPTADERKLGHRVKRNKSREVPLRSWRHCLNKRTDTYSRLHSVK
jgi:hypothetical protein